MFKPQHLLVEERGLGNQIKRIKDLIPTNDSAVTAAEAEQFVMHVSVKYLEEQLTAIVESLEDIKTGIKHENDRILKDQLKSPKELFEAKLFQK